jgi:RHS repeat-associated protein
MQKLFILIYFLSLHFVICAEENEDFTPGFDFPQETHLLGLVDLCSGNPSYSLSLLEGGEVAALPLQLQIAPGTDNAQYFSGCRFNYHSHLATYELKKQSASIYAYLDCGDRLPLFKNSDFINQTQSFSPANYVIKKSINLCGSEISAHTNLKNISATYQQGTKNTGTITVRDGKNIEKIYRNIFNTKDYTLIHEKFPNGLSIDFSRSGEMKTLIHAEHLPKMWELKNRNGEVIRKITRELGDNNVTFKTDRSESVSLFYTGKHLNKITRKYAPTEEWNGSQYIRGKGSKILINGSSISKNFKGPFEVIYKYGKEYNDNSEKHSTTVEDVYGNKTIYKYKEGRILDEIKRAKGREKYIWGAKNTEDQGTFYGKEIYDELNTLLTKESLEYDDRGNVLKHLIEGDLTGDGSKSILITEKTYSNNGFNLVMSQRESDGPTEHYSYIPGTNLLESKYTIVDEQIIHREFYEYNENAMRTKVISDDGSAMLRDDSANVTVQLIEEVDTVKDRTTHGFCLPKEVRKGYIDRTTLKSTWLKIEQFTYGPGDLLIKKDVIGSDGQLAYSIDYEYDDRHRLIRETTPLGHVIHKEYDENFQVIATYMEGSGFKTFYTRDFGDRILEERIEYDSGEIEITQFSYDPYDHCIEEIDPYGNKTKRNYDARGNEIRIEFQTNGKGGSSLITRKHDYFGNVIEETDPNGNTIRKKYTIGGAPSEIIYPDGGTETFRYNVNDTLRKKTHVNGSYTEYRYNPLKKITYEAHFSLDGTLLNWTRYEYDRLRIKSKEDASGLVLNYFYDDAGREIRIEEVTQNATAIKSFQYDRLGNVCKESHHLDLETYDYIKQYDEEGNLLEETEEWEGKLLKKVQYEYDINNQVIEKTIFVSEIECSIEKYFYNTRGDLIESIDPLGNRTFIKYNHKAINRLEQKSLEIESTDPLGRKIRKQFDGYSRELFEEILDESGKRLAAKDLYYDPAGNLRREYHHVYENGVFSHEYLIEYIYDSMNRVIMQTEQSHKKMAIFTNGNGGGISIDPLTGKFVKSSDVSSIAKLAKTTIRRYDATGNMIQLHLPSGIKIDYTYDYENRLIARKSSDGTVDEMIEYDFHGNPTWLVSAGASGIYGSENVISRTYTQFDQIESEEFGNGAKIHFEYDSLKRLTNIRYHDGSSAHYHYQDGRLEKIVRVQKNGDEFEIYDEEYDLRGALLRSSLRKNNEKNRQVIKHEWDLLGRKISSLHSAWAQNVTEIDSLGNLISMEMGPKGSVEKFQYEYDSLNQLRKEISLFTHDYRFDSIHNCIEKDKIKFLVNDFNQVLKSNSSSMKYDADGNRTDKNSTKYTYDAIGRLIKIEETGKPITHCYDPLNRRISTHENGENRIYMYQDTLEIGSMKKGWKISELRILRNRMYEDVGSAVMVELDGVVYFPLMDHRGNCGALLDHKGNLIESNQYSAFGEVVTQGKIANPWKFSSKRQDSTGLIYFGERYYDPESQTWLTPDPAGFRDGPNLYAYLHGNPLFSIDPTGLEQERPLIENENRKREVIDQKEQTDRERGAEQIKKIVSDAHNNAIRNIPAIVDGFIEGYSHPIDATAATCNSVRGAEVANGGYEGEMGRSYQLGRALGGCVGYAEWHPALWATVKGVKGLGMGVKLAAPMLTTAKAATTSTATKKAATAHMKDVFDITTSGLDYIGKGTNVSRHQAFRIAKQKSGLLLKQTHPNFIKRIPLRDQDKRLILSREYNFIIKKDTTVIIREHSLGHKDGAHGPHFNTIIMKGPEGNQIEVPLKCGIDHHTHFYR